MGKNLISALGLNAAWLSWLKKTKLSNKRTLNFRMKIIIDLVTLIARSKLGNQLTEFRKKKKMQNQPKVMPQPFVI